MAKPEDFVGRKIRIVKSDGSTKLAPIGSMSMARRYMQQLGYESLEELQKDLVEDEPETKRST